jgi:hypothetical protein
MNHQKKVQSETSSFLDILQGKVKIIVFEPNLNDIQNILEVLNTIPVYSIKIVTSIQDVYSSLSNGNSYQICLSELCHGTIERPCDYCGTRDRYYLQKKYGDYISILYISNVTCIECGYQLKALGAKGVFSKPITASKCKLIINQINNCFLDSLLTPKNRQPLNSTMKTLCSIIRDHNPGTVSEWAWIANCDDSYLRKMWRAWFYFQPKYTLRIYKLFKHFFDHVLWDMYENNGNISKKCFQYSNKYFSLRKEVLDEVIFKKKTAVK